MSPEALTELIIQYRYWILIPLSFLEGPIIAFVAGTLAAIGYFNIYALAALFFVRDVGADGLYYMVGHFGGGRAFIRGILGRLGITEGRLEAARASWMRRLGVTIFFGKLAYGLSVAFIIAAGIMKMPPRPFFAYVAVVAVLQYGTLLLLGYFLGTSFGGSVQTILTHAYYVIGLGAVLILGYIAVSLRLRKRFIEEDQKY